MPKKNKNSLEGLINGIEKVSRLFESYNGQIVDLSQAEIFTQGPYLHQDSEDSTEEESAAFERNNPELFNFLQSISLEVDNILKRSVRK